MENDLEKHRQSLSFTYEDLLRYSKTWPCAYGWWAWMGKTPWKPRVEISSGDASPSLDIS